ncbi:MAG: hypothetical protein KKG10_15365 [Proteobacteria bacterium]|nr:hypothetical protein [Pseudomonadota bacterium]
MLIERTIRKHIEERMFGLPISIASGWADLWPLASDLQILTSLNPQSLTKNFGDIKPIRCKHWGA